MPPQLTKARREIARVIKNRRIPIPPHVCEKHPALLANVRNVLDVAKWEIANNDEPGMTWLELTVAFKSQGYRTHDSIRDSLMQGSCNLWK